MGDTPTMTRDRGRVVFSYVQGSHLPSPRLVDGRWRCRDCGRRLSRYRDDGGVVRLRHYWRDRRATA